MPLLLWILLTIFHSTVQVPAKESVRDYGGYRVIRAIADTKVQQEALRRAVREQGGNCEFLKEAHRLGLPSDFMCNSGHLAEMVADRVRREQGRLHTLVHSLGEIIEEQRKKRVRVKRQAEGMNWEDYQRYDTIIAWIEEIAVAHPDIVTVTDLGRSHEDRKILMVKIGRSPLGPSTRAVWIDGGIHAREWIAPATATYLLNKLVETFTSRDNSTLQTRAVQSVDWYVAPLLNPDGYEYSHTNDRMWRKNRAPPPKGSNCYGVDLNRNWDVIGFGAGATSSNPCSETYKGTSRNSEPETKAVAAAVLAIKENVRIYLSFHSYGQYWLTSWGYKKKLPVDNDKMVRLGRQAVEAMQCVTPDLRYTIGSAGAIFYIAGGASDDFAKATAVIPYSFTVELPDQGRYGFLLPANKIDKTGQELWAALGVLAMETARHNLGPDPAQSADPGSYSDSERRAHKYL